MICVDGLVLNEHGREERGGKEFHVFPRRGMGFDRVEYVPGESSSAVLEAAREAAAEDQSRGGAPGTFEVASREGGGKIRVTVGE